MIEKSSGALEGSASPSHSRVLPSAINSADHLGKEGPVITNMTLLKNKKKERKSQKTWNALEHQDY